MNVRKTIRVLAVSFAVLSLLVFSTTVVSDWDCHTPADDMRCPYCHLTHQAPVAETESSQSVSLLEPVDSLPLPEDAGLAAAPVLTEMAPRAPPAA